MWYKRKDPKSVRHKLLYKFKELQGHLFFFEIHKLKIFEKTRRFFYSFLAFITLFQLSIGQVLKVLSPILLLKTDIVKNRPESAQYDFEKSYKIAYKHDINCLHQKDIKIQPALQKVSRKRSNQSFVKGSKIEYFLVFCFSKAGSDRLILSFRKYIVKLESTQNECNGKLIEL